MFLAAAWLRSQSSVISGNCIDYKGLQLELVQSVRCAALKTKLFLIFRYFFFPILALDFALQYGEQFIKELCNG